MGDRWNVSAYLLYVLPTAKAPSGSNKSASSVKNAATAAASFFLYSSSSA